MSATNKPARRGFLALLSGAVAVPAVAVAPTAVAAAASPPVPAEAPELLAIGEKLAPVFRGLRPAVEALKEARKLYRATKPVPPDELVPQLDPARAYVNLAEREYDHAGESIQVHKPWDLCVVASRKVRAHMIMQEISGRTSE